MTGIPHLQSFLETAVQAFAQTAVEQVLNSLPEGLLIALFAWLMLRAMGRQNAGTRFAVWITALIAIVGLPLFAVLDSVFSRGHSHLPGSIHPQVTVKLFWVAPICALWAIGAGVAMARLLAGLRQVRAIRKSCTVIDPAQLDTSLQERVRKVLEQSGMSRGASRPVRIAESDKVRVPAAIGFWRPMIVFPSWALCELSPDELNAILIHELAHLRRKDDWTNLFQKIVRAVFFFHPAVWWIDARLTLEREMACDDAVLAETGNSRAYASCLIGLLEKSCAHRGWAMAQAAVHHAHDAALRIAQILDPHRDPRRPATTRIRKIAPGLAGIFSLVCIGVLLCAPRLIVFLPDETSVATHTTRNTMGRMPEAAVFPASFRVDRPAAHALPVRTVAPSRNARSAMRLTAPKRAAAPFPQTAPRSASVPAGVRARAVLAKADQGESFRVSTLVFVEATEIEAGAVKTAYAADTNLPMWRIQVLRLVFIASVQPDKRDGVMTDSI